MEIIQDVGAYAGFAAVIGLAVLSALYFSQARDVRRLREWAGRAPERVAEGATAQQIAAQQGAPERAAQDATRPAATGAVRPIPAAKPAAASAGATPATVPQPAEKKEGEKPAAPAPPVPATAAAAAKGAPAGPGGAAKTEAKPAAATPAAGAPSAPAPTAASPKGPPPVTAPPVPSVPGPAGPGGSKPPTLPPRPAPVARAPGASPTSQSTAVLPPSSRLRERRSDGRRRLDSRYIALIVAGVIVVGGGAAFGISQLGGGDETGGQDGQQASETPAGPLNRSLVTVSVLNGTTVPGLAAQIGDEVESKGFQRGNVANAIDQQRPQSVVMFAEGAERAARVVARGLGISQLEPVDPDSQALAGNASVVVIVGMDQTQ